MSKYLLFAWEPYDQRGGMGDLCHVGTLEECIKAAESSQQGSVAEIIDHETLCLAKQGAWVSERRSDRTGLTSDMGIVDWRFEWESDQDCCEPLSFAPPAVSP
jgi:hypothetical protein